jgi:anti-sigma factor RsiW
MKMERFHPADDRLIALYFGDEEAGVDERRAVRQHLHGCETCTWRYTELTAPLERLRQDAAGEADEVFTPARLDAQRAKVLARLTEEAPASRIIPFPASGARPDRSVVRRPLTRWVAAAAAAGILVGVVGGRLLENGTASSVAKAPVARTVIAALPGSDAVSDSLTETAAIEGDEAVISEIEQAVFTHRITALSALDDLTPHVRQEAVLARAVR